MNWGEKQFEFKDSNASGQGFVLVSLYFDKSRKLFRINVNSGGYQIMADTWDKIVATVEKERNI